MLDRIEKKIGKYAIKNLIYYILGGYVVGYVLLLTNARLGLLQYITLEPALVMKGQVWRLFTWICTPPQGLSFFIIFMFLLYLYIGKSLEQNLGTFKYNLYMISGWFFMTLGTMVMYWITSAVNGPAGAISMNVSTYYLNLASFLAFAVLFPDVRVYFFGILPIRMKILAIIDVAYLGLQVVTSVISLLLLPNPEWQSILVLAGWTKQTFVTEIFSILISLLNFIIFFLATRNLRRLSPKEVKRRKEFEKNVKEGQRQNPNAAGLAAVLREVQKSDEEEEQAEEDVTDQETEEQPRRFGPYVGPTHNMNNDTNHEHEDFFGEDNTPKRKFGYGSHAAGYSKASERTTKEPEKVSRYNNAGQGLLHTCSICGRTSVTNPELTFRYCSKCEGNHEYCEDHLFTHVHVQ